MVRVYSSKFIICSMFLLCLLCGLIIIPNNLVLAHGIDKDIEKGGAPYATTDFH